MKRRSFLTATATAPLATPALAHAAEPPSQPTTTNPGIDIDFTSVTHPISPHLFGVVHYPSCDPHDPDIGEHLEVWDQMVKTLGVRFLRADARLHEILPLTVKRPGTGWNNQRDPYVVTGPDGVKRPFTLAGYREDMEHHARTGRYLTGLSNPANWNTDRLLRWIRTARDHGFDVMVMTFQVPEWLGADVDGIDAWGKPRTSANSAPRDWKIFRDIMGKLYTLVRPYAFAYELLNEPHGFVFPGNGERPGGGRYSSIDQFAADYFYQAIDAMYAAERALTGRPDARPAMLLGGGGDDQWSPTYGVLGEILSPERAEQARRIDFLSIHNYSWRPVNPAEADGRVDGEPSGTMRALRRFVTQRAGRDIPLYLNEWNLSPGNPVPALPQVRAREGVPYHARTFLDALHERVNGMAYYTFYPGDVPMDDYQASMGWIEKGHGGYLWNNGSPQLRPFAQVWNLLSHRLAMGSGTGHAVATQISGLPAGIDSAQGVLAPDGTPEAIVLNWSSAKASIPVRLSGLKLKDGEAILEVSIIDGTVHGAVGDIPAPTRHRVAIADGKIQSELTIPAAAVAGVRILKP
ncbi:hypothetical protein [Devriesea agamarum]|uniref:hypothetical protein n=1 Tax=Devriesea agamarum TaxID=472569 RepID=UPI00071D946D|nr:hypothetical protein [Devriesea agamarum]